jgi:DNA-binding response OmpR family regulator
MMTTRESGARKPRPMQCLLLAPEQHPREALRQFLADKVERHASKVDETACLTEFQQRLAERDYDLVLVALDPSIRIPWGSWRVFSDDMKVLFVSGYSEQVVSRYKIADIQALFLQKPFTLKTLAVKVREALDKQASAASVGH